ncbi:MAG: hypothetical protein AB7N70_21115 [Dehalococcoidia bacterium]
MQRTDDRGPGIHTDVLALPVVLAALRAAPAPEGGVLSAYLPVKPVQVAGQAHLVRFREACKEIRAGLDGAGRDERNAFEAATGRIEQYLSDTFEPRHPGLAIFAAAQPEYLFAVPLPARPGLEVVWDPLPALATLEMVLDDHERVAVVLSDQRRARLFTIFLGSIETSEQFESADPGKRNVAGIAGNYAGSHRNQILSHARRTAHAAVELLRQHPFDRLLLGGPEESQSVLQNALPRPLRTRLAGAISMSMAASDAEVLAAALQAAAEIERAAEVALVDELIESATPQRAALGLHPTLEALNEGRIHHLIIAEGFDATGGECPACGWLVAGLDPCPHCGGQPAAVPDLREHVVDRALDQGARIETVSGDAGVRLMVHDGIGARVRY